MGEEHREFKEFLKFMFVLDPSKRPSAKECLEHPFITGLGSWKDGVARKRHSDPLFFDDQSTRNESKSTEKTTQHHISSPE